MKRYIIEMASADFEPRPGSTDEKSNDENWTQVAEGLSAKEALENYITACNDDIVSIENNWLRLRIEDNL